MADAETLRSRLARKPIVVAPGVYDPFTALVAMCVLLLVVSAVAISRYRVTLD
jgi:2-methylisocitrate lyase-like PEP mutase family enzyme